MSQPKVAFGVVFLLLSVGLSGCFGKDEVPDSVPVDQCIIPDDASQDTTLGHTGCESGVEKGSNNETTPSEPEVDVRIITPSVSNITNQSAYLSWSTNYPADAQASCEFSHSSQRGAQRFTLQNVHVLYIDGLPEESSIDCTIRSQNATAHLSFSTIPTSSSTDLSTALQFVIGSPNGSIYEMRSTFSKHIEVFGSHVVSTQHVSDADLMHAATVLAEYLDNDEDGVLDDRAIAENLSSTSATIVMAPTESDLESAIGDLPDSFLQKVDQGIIEVQALFGDETINPNEATSDFDATLEEVLHLVTHVGWAKAYPDLFAEASGSRIANLMDAARGGHFEETNGDACEGGSQCSLPNGGAYPDGAWYTYDDDTCSYECMITEYVYWGLTSHLGAQANRCSEIEHEWKPCTSAKFQSTDPDFYALLTNTSLNLPSSLPNGTYLPILIANNSTNSSLPIYDPCTVPAGSSVGPSEGNHALDVRADSHSLGASIWVPWRLCDQFVASSDDGKFFLLIWISTDCSHCWNHAPTIEDWNAVYGDQLEIVLLAANFSSNDNFNATREEVEAFQAKSSYMGCYYGTKDCNERPGTPHDLLYLDDRNQSQMYAWGVTSTPNHVIINPHGTVIWHQAQSGSSEPIDDALQRMFGAA